MRLARLVAIAVCMVQLSFAAYSEPGLTLSNFAEVLRCQTIPWHWPDIKQESWPIRGTLTAVDDN